MVQNRERQPHNQLRLFMLYLIAALASRGGVKARTKDTQHHRNTQSWGAEKKMTDFFLYNGLPENRKLA
jgi:hypothetical protein